MRRQHLVVHSKWLCSLATVAAIGFATASARAADAPARPIDPAYITPDAAVVAVAHPHLILSQPGMASMPVEVLSAATLKEFGFDGMDVDELLAVVAKVVPAVDTPHGKDEPDVGVVIRLSKPVSVANLEKKLLRGTTAATLDGHAIYQAHSEREPSFFIATDGKTIVVAPVAMLKRMLAVQTPAGLAVTLLKQLDSNTQAGALIAVEPIRAALKAQLATAPQLPPALEELKKLPDQLDFAKLTLALHDSLVAKLTLSAHDAAAGEAAEKELLAASEFGRQMALAQIAQNQPKSDDPVEQASLKYMQRIINFAFDKAKPIRQGQAISLTAEATPEVALMVAVPIALLAPRRAAMAKSIHGESIPVEKLPTKSEKGN